MVWSRDIRWAVELQIVAEPSSRNVTVHFYPFIHIAMKQCSENIIINLRYDIGGVTPEPPANSPLTGRRLLLSHHLPPLRHYSSCIHHHHPPPISPSMTRTSPVSQTPTAVDIPIDPSTGGVPRTAQPKARDAAQAETGAKLDSSQFEFQHSLHLPKEVERALTESYAYIERRDVQGNLVIRGIKGDPRNPRSWPNWKRYAVVGLASWLNNLVREEEILELHAMC